MNQSALDFDAPPAPAATHPCAGCGQPSESGKRFCAECGGIAGAALDEIFDGKTDQVIASAFTCKRCHNVTCQGDALPGKDMCRTCAEKFSGYLRGKILGKRCA